jgi:hypothetical protein
VLAVFAASVKPAPPSAPGLFQAVAKASQAVSVPASACGAWRPSAAMAAGLPVNCESIQPACGLSRSDALMAPDPATDRTGCRASPWAFSPDLVPYFSRRSFA